MVVETRIGEQLPSAILNWKSDLSGHTQTKLNFHKEVYETSNPLGIFAGHIHRNSIEIIKGKPQIVTNDNASGGYLDIDFKPMEEMDKKLI